MNVDLTETIQIALSKMDKSVPELKHKNEAAMTKWLMIHRLIDELQREATTLYETELGPGTIRTKRAK